MALGVTKRVALDRFKNLFLLFSIQLLSSPKRKLCSLNMKEGDNLKDPVVDMMTMN